MTNNINYKDTIFKRANLTPIRGKPNFKMLHKLRNEIKSNSKSISSNLGVGSHGCLGLVLTESQYSLISPTPFVYPTHPGPLIIPDGTTAHADFNMRIMHTEEVRLFHEVTGFGQSLIQ